MPINIAGRIDELLIFDDPKYCCTSHRDKCSKLHWTNVYCYAFNSDLTMLKTKRHVYKKCDACKTAWKKAKEKRIVSFNILPLGTRFKYTEIDKIFVKIDINTVAEWNESQIETNWIGQRVMSAFETDAELKTKVEVVR